MLLGGSGTDRALRPSGAMDYLYLAVLLSMITAGFVEHFSAGTDELVALYATDRWSFRYLFGSTITHEGWWHFFGNWFGMLLFGGVMIGYTSGRIMALLFWLAMLVGQVANNLLGSDPAFGMSAGIMGIFAFLALPFCDGTIRVGLLWNMRVKLWIIAYAVVCFDIMGIVLDWPHLPHWAHLGGFATGLLFALVYFRKPLLMLWMYKKIDRER